jgi:methylated-DNA-[protein]-cysteine S-methyltransferase
MSVRTKKSRAEELRVCLMDTPLGHLTLAFTPKGLAALEFEEDVSKISLGPPAPAAMDAMMDGVVKDLQVFFEGKSVDFSRVPLDLQGTPFQIKVWEELRRIPRGETISYRELASRVGQPQAVRAVGQANSRNPVPIIIPCHRVIAADGGLGGYSSGLERKEWLLKHEGAR